MKQSFRTFAVMQFLLLYSIVIVLNSGISTPSDAKGFVLGKETGQSSFDIAEGVKLLYHTNQNENVSGLLNIIPVAAVNNTYDFIFNTSAKEQQILIANHSAYKFIADKLLLRLSQTDIIYPFHYFW